MLDVYYNTKSTEFKSKKMFFLYSQKNKKQKTKNK